MTEEEFNQAISFLVERNGLVLPYGFMPGSEPGGSVDVWSSEEKWNEYPWNPPYYLREDYSPDGYPVPDLDASDKPAWIELLTALTIARRYDRLEELYTTLRSECRRRITEAFGASDALDELFIRQANDDTKAQRQERRRLLARHKWLRGSLDTMSDEDLLKFNPEDDFLWVESPPLSE